MHIKDLSIAMLILLTLVGCTTNYDSMNVESSNTDSAILTPKEIICESNPDLQYCAEDPTLDSYDMNECLPFPGNNQHDNPHCD